MKTLVALFISFSFSIILAAPWGAFAENKHNAAYSEIPEHEIDHTAVATEAAEKSIAAHKAAEAAKDEAEEAQHQAEAAAKRAADYKDSAEAAAKVVKDAEQKSITAHEGAVVAQQEAVKASEFARDNVTQAASHQAGAQTASGESATFAQMAEKHVEEAKAIVRNLQQTKTEKKTYLENMDEILSMEISVALAGLALAAAAFLVSIQDRSIEAVGGGRSFEIAQQNEIMKNIILISPNVPEDVKKTFQQDLLGVRSPMDRYKHAQDAIKYLIFAFYFFFAATLYTVSVDKLIEEHTFTAIESVSGSSTEGSDSKPQGGNTASAAQESDSEAIVVLQRVKIGADLGIPGAAILGGLIWLWIATRSIIKIAGIKLMPRLHPLRALMKLFGRSKNVEQPALEASSATALGKEGADGN